MRDAIGPVLVTGMPRAATSWVGKMLAGSGRFTYLNEPLNPQHPPGRSPGVLRYPFDKAFPYAAEDDADAVRRAFDDMLSLRYHPVAELRVNRRPYDLLRMVRTWGAFRSGRLAGRAALLDDPYAVFLSRWLAGAFDCTVINVVRHPAALVHSHRRVGMDAHLLDVVTQPALMRDVPAPLREQLTRAVNSRADVLRDVSLLWRLVYSMAGRWASSSAIYHLVRYEDLCQSPVEGFRTVFGHVGVEFTGKVRDRVLAGATFAGAVSEAGWVFSWRDLSKTAYRPMDSRRNAIAWREHITDGELERIRELTADVGETWYPDEADWQSGSLEPLREAAQ